MNEPELYRMGTKVALVVVTAGFQLLEWVRRYIIIKMISLELKKTGRDTTEKDKS